MDGYPALREVYEELLRATGQLNITADSLRAFGNNCAELRTMLAKAGQDGQELQDEVEPLSGEARNLRDATSAEQAELKRAVEFVGQTRTKMEDACQRILELTVALRERTADLVSHTKQILLLTSLFVKQPDASPVTVGETGPELMT